MPEMDTVLQGRYQIISHIGKGGMGTVYLAKDLNLGITVAVKQNFFTEQRLIEAFKREARLVASLRHPALPQVKDHFIIEGTGQFLVMEYISGDDLETILEKRRRNIRPIGEPKPFEVDEVIAWAEQLLDALDYLHSRREPVIHRDIKPQNLKLAERNQIILLDFGLAKGKPLQMTRVTTTGSIYGYTPNYAPLEQIRGLGTDPRSDLYALGATLYHLLTGMPPIDAATRADSYLGGEPDPLRPASELNSKVPPSLSEVFLKAMEQHRRNRLSSAREMLEMLCAAKRAPLIEQREDARKEADAQDNMHQNKEQQKQEIEKQEDEKRSEQKELERRASEKAERLRREQDLRAEDEAERKKLQEAQERKAGEETQPPRLVIQTSAASELARSERSANKRWLVIIIAGLIMIALVVMSRLIISSGEEPLNKRFSTLTNTANFVRIERGEFMIGSQNGESNEKPVRQVRISRSFAISKYEVMQAQWEEVMGSNPSYFKGRDLPVENVSWDNVQQFIKRLNAQNDGYIYRLPTEAEWEYACRVGNTADYAGNLDEMGWHRDNSDGMTHPVGQKQPNALGLFDMRGNVWEWCQDWYSSNAYSSIAAVDPTGPSSGSFRVLRGGSCGFPAEGCRASFRNADAPDARSPYVGFRLVRLPR